MKMNIFLYVWIVTAGGLYAEVLTLDNAKTRALQANPQLQAAHYAQKSAAWSATSAYLDLIPTAQATGGYTSYDPALVYGTAGTYETVRSYGLSVTQPIFYGGKLWYGARIKKDQAEVAEYTVESQTLATLAGTESKYLAVLEQKALLAVCEKDREASQKHLETAEVRFKTGTLSKADLLKIRSQAAAKEVTLVQMRNQYDLNRLDLAMFLQIGPDFDLAEISMEKYDPIMAILRDLAPDKFDRLQAGVMELGLHHNPTLKIASKSEDIARKSLRIAKGNFFPTISLSYSKYWEKNDLNDGYEDQATVMISASLPLLPLADNVSGHKKAECDFLESEYTYRAARDEISVLIKQLLYGLICSAKSIDAAQVALEYARATYEQTEDRFEHDLVSTSDMLDAEVLFNSAENLYITGIYDYLRAQSALMQYTGLRDESVLLNVITTN